ncbi:hypothetical protein GDO81_021261 [Engystomops pustulosus]|uniref:Uncharacterized protein n=1 Tax=Engystomops pustulosus TaxID=76066 RepID=A0AAV6ZMN0_ENGPU|nr:hypothetical protein GDO81_021261 [Engystomops pustulosus]
MGVMMRTDEGSPQVLPSALGAGVHISGAASISRCLCNDPSAVMSACTPPLHIRLFCRGVQYLYDASSRGSSRSVPCTPCTCCILLYTAHSCLRSRDALVLAPASLRCWILSWLSLSLLSSRLLTL